MRASATVSTITGSARTSSGAPPGGSFTSFSRPGRSRPNTYPPIEPYESGRLDVGDGNLIYWEACGNPMGKPALVLHGGPGSGCTPGMRCYFDPSAYRIVLFDQRGCGRSTPHASDSTVDLSSNTTHHLLGDIERLRQHLSIERWLVFGASWGSTLAIAYAEAFPKQVSEMVLASVVTTTRREVRWVTFDVRRFFPRAWKQFREGLPEADGDGDLVAGYRRLLADRDPIVREKAAYDWCQWEDSHVAVHSDSKPSARYQDPRFRMAFARLVTHYWHHAAWLEDGRLLGEARRLASIPAVLVHGRIDLSSPIDIPWNLSQNWPGSELVIIDDAGHGIGEPATARALVAATDRFSRPVR